MVFETTCIDNAAGIVPPGLRGYAVSGYRTSRMQKENLIVLEVKMRLRGEETRTKSGAK